MGSPAVGASGVSAPVRYLRGLQGWPVWGLPPRLRGYVLAVIAASMVALILAALHTTWRLHNALLFGVLLAIGMITVESIRRIGEPALAGKDAHGIWELAIVLLLPPFYALAAPLVVHTFIQCRVRRTLLYRRAFSAAALGLANGATSLVFHALWRQPGYQHRPLTWALLAVGCAALRWALNYALVVTAIKLDDPAARLGDLTGGPGHAIYNDGAELFLGILVAVCAYASPLLPIAVLPWAVMLERSARRAQLRHVSRTDPITHLLTGEAWRREANVAVTRARRTRAPLAVAIINIDHLQNVGDAYGAEATESVLFSVGHLLSVSVRDGDLAGRLGHQELTVLITRADADEAIHVAERLQRTFRRIALRADPLLGVPPYVSTSIGVACLGGTITDLTDLLTAADTALTRAKRAGRDTIRVVGHPGPPAQPGSAALAPARNVRGPG